MPSRILPTNSIADRFDNVTQKFGKITQILPASSEFLVEFKDKSVTTFSSDVDITKNLLSLVKIDQKVAWLTSDTPSRDDSFRNLAELQFIGK